MTEHTTVLGDRYELDQVIGRGGMAEVWRARDTRLGRLVAVKRLRVDLATDPTFQARFRREAQSAAGLNHPNIVATYDTGEEPDEKTGIAVPWIVMELVEGHTLRDLLREDRRIRPEMALEFTQGVLDALFYSHKAGIIHRDIKPANVMITPSGRVKVMDFGIARAVADTSATMTQTAAVIGTAQYLSPEQARGETVDTRSDIYSAGCLLYELLAGRPPFVGDSPVSVAYQHVREVPTPPSQLDPEITDQMDAITLKALAKDPADRYQDAKQMRDDITRLLAGQAISAVPPLPPVEQPTQLYTQPTAVTQVVGAETSGATLTGSTLAGGALGTMDAPGAQTETGSLVAVEEPRRRSPLGWIIAFLLAALIGVGGYGIYTLTRSPSSDLVEVPGVTTMTETSATDTLKASGFQVAAKHVTGADDKTVGTVTAQDPKAGTQRAKGSSVTITVNDGPKTTTIPKGIVNQDEKVARAVLTKAGFTNVTTTEASAEEEAKNYALTDGQVAAVDPAEGAQVPASQPIVLKLASGRSELPNVANYTIEGATERLSGRGFTKIKVVEEEVADTNVIGKVIKQDPGPDGQVTRTQTITLTLGKAPNGPTMTPTPVAPTTAVSTPAPTTVTVPDLAGRKQKQAERALTQLGLQPNVQTVEVVEKGQVGVVIAQDPPAGGSVAQGGTVTLTIGVEAPASTPDPSTAPSPSTPVSQPPTTPTASSSAS